MRKLLSFFLCLVLLLSLPLTASAEPSPPPYELTVLVEGGNDTIVRAYQDSYRGNLYLSLIDLSQALNGTAGQFRILLRTGRGVSPGTREQGGLCDGRPSALHIEGQGGAQQAQKFRVLWVFRIL